MYVYSFWGKSNKKKRVFGHRVCESLFGDFYDIRYFFFYEGGDFVCITMGQKMDLICVFSIVVVTCILTMRQRVINIETFILFYKFYLFTMVFKWVGNH